MSGFSHPPKGSADVGSPALSLKLCARRSVGRDFMYFRFRSEACCAAPGSRRTCFIGNGVACQEMRSGMGPEGPRCCANAEVIRSDLEESAAPDAAAPAIIKVRREILDMSPPRTTDTDIVYSRAMLFYFCDGNLERIAHSLSSRAVRYGRRTGGLDSRS